MRERISLYLPPVDGIDSYFQMIDLAHECGIRYIDFLDMYEFYTPDREKAAALRRYLDERGMQACCMTACSNLVSDNDEARARNIAKTKEYVDVAEILGAPLFHHTIATDLNNPQKMRDNHERYLQQALAATQEIYDYASAKGMRTVSENQGFLFNGVANVTEFLSRAKHPFGVVGDIGNILFVEEHAVDFLPHVMSHVAHMHIKDYIYTVNPTREKQKGELVTADGNYVMDCPFGEGCVDFDRVFAILKEHGYDGLLSLECPPIGEDSRAILEQNIAYLERYEL